MLFDVEDCVDDPVSLYAATKKSNDFFAHCYSKLYDIPTIGMRFFTVYDSAGRPDRAYFCFTSKPLSGETIQITTTATVAATSPRLTTLLKEL